MKERKGTPIRTYTHKGVKGRSLTTQEEYRSKQVERITKEVNEYYGKIEPFFSHSHALTIRLGISLSEYMNKALTDKEVFDLYKSKGKYKNNVQV